MKLEDLKTSSFEYGLTKILGKKVKEINGYISSDYGEPTFKITSVVLDDDTCIDCEGEHDLPYLAYNKDLDEKCIEIKESEEKENEN